MAIMRIRTTVDERPGRLASLAAALAEGGGNILGLSVQSDADGTVDEFMAEVPASAEKVREALEAAGGRRVQVVPATAHELVDEPTRALLLADRVRATPWLLPRLLADLLRADDARWVYGAAVNESGDHMSESGDHGIAYGSDHPVDLPDPTLLTVPVGERRAVRVRRSGLPFTLTEAARAAAFVRLAQPPAEPGGAERTVRLDDGAEVTVVPLMPFHREAVNNLHERCSPESRRFRYFTALPSLPPRVFERLCDRGQGRSLLAGHDGQAIAIASLMFTPDPGVAELAFLVQDRWQGRGLGGTLARMLVRQARDLGFAEVKATLLSDNIRMRRLMLSLGATLAYTDDPGVLEARLPIAVPACL